MKKALIVASILAFGPLAANGAIAADPLAGSPSMLKGEVLEVQQADPYTYLRLKTTQGEVWAAVPKVPATKGAQITIVDVSVMENFESKTLKRTFPTIAFGTVGVPAPVPATPGKVNSAGPAHAEASIGQIHGGIGKSVEVDVAKVAKADGPTGRTVAEVNANRATLKDKTVTIRAKVVKVNANVMGKNWVHLRDGSGAAADQSNDLLVTSKEEPKVGDIVIAKGTVKTDVDLGSGYAYKVLVENASFQK